MMNQKRLERVLENLRAQDLGQMVITDPASIFYLTGRFIEPGERLLALILNTSGKNSILINNLFTVPEDLGVVKVRFDDTDDSVRLLASCIEAGGRLGVDKNMPARFLLPLMEMGAAAGYELSSACVDGARACKDEAERALMREASRLNDEGMAVFSQWARPGITEREMAAHIEETYCSLGADGCSFTPLVGFGANAAIGHHEPDDTPLAEGDCVLLDVGCKKDGYCADMTRTFFFRRMGEKQREVYDIVRRANAAAEAAVHPGALFSEIDRAARSVIKEAGYGEYFTHRLGHSIGIEVHEPGDVSSVHHEPVRPGMVFSIEPGIYLPGEFGVRIEDLVLVTEDGCEILNRFSKEPQILG